jgi:hypothetical protein
MQARFTIGAPPRSAAAERQTVRSLAGPTSRCEALRMNGCVLLLGLSVVCVSIVACSSGTATTGGAAGTGDGGGGGAEAGSNACGPTSADPMAGGIAFCSACINAGCCTQSTACAANADCNTLQVCLARCVSTDQLCTKACSDMSPNGVNDYNNVSNCTSKCDYACSTPPSGCTHKALGTDGRCKETPFPLLWNCPAGAPEPECVTSPDGTANDYCCLR